MDFKLWTDLFSHVKRPTRYLGREINAIYKDPRGMALRVALVFPDLYEVGMSHLGLALLYDLLNQQEDVWAERVYAPAPDMEAQLRKRRLPLVALESGSPLKDFDLVGVSLQYELSYTNLLNILDLGGIPLFAAQRGGEDPVVIGGGPAAFNPEPVAPFFDALVLGDGEEVIFELTHLLKDWKKGKGTRQELWQALEEVPGVYVPAYFEMVFDEGDRLREIVPRGRLPLVHKRLLNDLDRVTLSPSVLVSYCHIVHDRLNVEMSRGCTRGCRFCQAGMIYRPVRERQPEAVANWVAAALAATGYEELSLLSLSPGDYQALPELLPRLMNQLAPQRVALSLPSLRADTLTPEMISQIQRVRRTGLTIAPEAGSERLRRLINKNLPEEVILQAARRVFASGWRLLKLYFMVGLPGETPADREAIAVLVRQIQDCAPRGKLPQLHVSLSSFIPKPHTPFQWEAQADLDNSRRHLFGVKDGLRGKAIQVKWNSVGMSWLEGIFSRGDRRLASVLMSAYRRGCRLDAWSEHLHLGVWRQAFQEAGVEPEGYLRARRPDEVLPWQHLDCGVSREFLWEERNRAYLGVETPDCRLVGCHNCGVCDQLAGGTGFPACSSTETLECKISLPYHAKPESSGRSATWYRLTFAKMGEMRWLSHLELISAWYRALRRAGLPLAFTLGHHPLPKVMFHGALPVGMESLVETLDLVLTKSLPEEVVIEKVNLVLPSGLKVLYAQRLPRQAKPPVISGVVYQVVSPAPVFADESVARFLAQEEVMVTRQRPNEAKIINIRPLVDSVSVQDSCHLELVLKVGEKDNVKAADILAAIFALDPNQTAALQIMKTKAVSRDR